MKKFNCPSNPDVVISDKCPIEECPFHFNRWNGFFSSESNETNCFCIDHSSVFDRSVTAKNKQTALVRNSNKIIPEKKLREYVKEVTDYARIVYLLNEVPSKSRCFCGKKVKCGEKAVECESHNIFISQIISYYGLVASSSRITQANLLMEKGLLSVPPELKV